MNPTKAQEVNPQDKPLDGQAFLPPDWIHRFPLSKDRAMLRSITPSGFARAFFEANP